MLLIDKQGRNKRQATLGVPVLFLGFSAWLGLLGLGSFSLAHVLLTQP